MDPITALQAKRAGINERIQALAALEATGTELSAEQLAEFSDLEAQFKAIDAQIGRAKYAEAAAAAAAVPVDQPGRGQQAATGAGGLHVEPALKVAMKPGVAVAQMARSLASRRGDPRAAAEFAQKQGFNPMVVDALGAGSDSAGGVLIPENLSSEIIELLRPKAVVRSLGTRSIPLNNGNVTIPRLQGGAVVSYIGTDDDIPQTDEQFDDLKLSAKKLAALVPISNDLLKYAGPNQNVDLMVVGDLTAAIAQREDKAFIRDDGTGGTPKGLRYWAPGGSLIPAPDLSGLSGAPLLQAVDLALNTMILAHENNNAGMVSPGWLMAPRTRRWLSSLKTTTGAKFYPELDQGTLKGYPFKTTTQIPWNLGASGTESELYFADFGDCFIGENDDMRIDFSAEATYTDSSGKTVSAFQRDQTLVRVITHNDFGPRHPESVAVMTGITWGAGMAAGAGDSTT